MLLALLGLDERMAIAKIVYRVNQFAHALFARSLTPKEERIIDEILDSRGRALFRRMKRSEQKHALRVYLSLRDSGETNEDLLVAALLHDIGKSRMPLNILERVVIVLGNALFKENDGKRNVLSKLPFVNKAFLVSEMHAEWGAEMAELAGVSSLAVNLIRRHQEALPLNTKNSLEVQLLEKLQKADGKS